MSTYIISGSCQNLIAKKYFSLYNWSQHLKVLVYIYKKTFCGEKFWCYANDGIMGDNWDSIFWKVWFSFLYNIEYVFLFPKAFSKFIYRYVYTFHMGIPH